VELFTGSENFKLLYDIYHMQIMEGDVIGRHPRKPTPIFPNFHTGGVSGRNEIDGHPGASLPRYYARHRRHLLFRDSSRPGVHPQTPRQTRQSKQALDDL